MTEVNYGQRFASNLLRTCGDQTSSQLRQIERRWQHKRSSRLAATALKRVRGLMSPEMRLRDLDPDMIAGAFEIAASEPSFGDNAD